MQYDKLIANLQNLTDIRFSQASIGKFIGIKQTAVSNRVANKIPFSIDELIIIENQLALPAGSLSGIKSSDASVDLDYYPDVFASCGAGCVVFEENTEKISVTKDLINNYAPDNKYSVIVARGRSNEPTICDNDKLIVEHIENNSIIDNLLYVFSYEGQIYVKRLIKNIDEIVIVSDNPDKDTYRTQYVTKERMNEVKVIGKIVGLIREKV